MRYISTRGQAPAVSFLDAVLAGLAPDGGLYMPENWPVIGRDNGWAFTRHFHNSAGIVLGAFGKPDLGEQDEFGESPARALADSAYGFLAADKNWHRAITPLVQIDGGEWILELFHGPSLSFKDVAMQLIGPLYDYALTLRNEKLSVVCATSGDTGGAAVEAIKGSARSDLFVLMPKGRVSDVQKRFMTASGAANVHAIDIDGDFDACQAIVKALFADRNFSQRARLSGVNSINWARIVAQSVYFQVAAHTLCAPGPVDFVVPTGNFGDAFSGYVAKMCGAPIRKIVLATNANDILTRALQTGRYERAAHSHATLSPAMDIQVASNFERIIFEAVGRDGAVVRRLYDQFAQSGGFDIPPQALAFLREHFDATAVSDAETAETMRATWKQSGYLACPHTAVGLRARQQVSGLGHPLVTLATAHPAKFPDTVEQATGMRPPLPAKHADLFSRPERIDTLPNDVEAVKRFIQERSRAWS
ncbi:threonine synthase [Vitreimonas flagellata]|uniref:threonine synthase n=1 Tax=Vitreimonas flagellata TaxID=2560861 RepID=UPI001074F8CB|nr:threonine synthase [Vitreimonas flagellata]